MLFWKKKPFNLDNFTGGWEKGVEDERDYGWAASFSSSTPELKELPQKFSWRDKMPKHLPVQLQIPSCVMCSFAFVQAFNQQQEWNKDFRLSWRFLWANSPHSNKGANYREVAKSLRKMGTSSYALCPDKAEKGFSWVEDRINVSNEAATEALQHRINHYTFPDIFDIKRAIYRSPLPIAVGGNNDQWNRDNVKKNNNIVDYIIAKWYHSVVAVGWDGDKIEIANWFGSDWGDKGYGFLREGYPINAAISLEDLVINKERIVKVEGNSAVWRIFNGMRRAFASAKIYQEWFNDPDWQLVKTITEKELNSYKKGEKIIDKKFVSDIINNI